MTAVGRAWAGCRIAGWQVSIVVLLVCGVLGCNSNKPERAGVSGNVTFQDEPVQQGQIVLAPRRGSTMAVAPIVDGKYEIPAERGPAAGEYTVRITASRPTGKKIKYNQYGVESTQDEIKQYIPAAYNTSSTLVLEIEEAGPVSKDFHLEAK